MNAFEQAADRYWDRVNADRILREWREAGFCWTELLHRGGDGLSPKRELLAPKGAWQ